MEPRRIGVVHTSADEYAWQQCMPQTQVDRPGIPVDELAYRITGVKPTNSLEIRSSNQKRRRAQASEPPSRLDQPLQLFRAIGADEFFHVGKAHIGIAIFEAPDLGFQLAGQPDVVRVQEGKERAYRQRNTMVASRRGSHPALPNVAQARVAERLSRIARAIRRAVINHNNLNIVNALRYDAAQSFGQVGLPIEHRYDYCH